MYRAQLSHALSSNCRLASKILSGGYDAITVGGTFTSILALCMTAFPFVLPRLVSAVARDGPDVMGGRGIQSGSGYTGMELSRIYRLR